MSKCESATLPFAIRNSTFYILCVLCVLCGNILFFLSQCASTEVGPIQETAAKKNIRRACLTLREIGWAGSVSNNGKYDPDDDFLEIQNTDCNIDMDLTGFRIFLHGDEERIYTVPTAPGLTNLVKPRDYIVIAAKTGGAFGGHAQVILPGMHFPNRNFTIETKTREDFLMENEINIRDGLPLAGGYDGYTTRSMERTDDRFDEEGTALTSWHSSSPCNERSPGSFGILGSACRDDATSAGLSGSRIVDGFEKRTFATPGEENTGGYR